MLHSEVLLLNLGYEVLGTVSVQRSVRLLLRENNPAHLVEPMIDKDGNTILLHTGKEFTMPKPSVIRLSNYVSRSHSKSHRKLKKKGIFARDFYRCGYCKKKLKGKEATLDHIVPRAQKGDSSPMNLVTCCKPCNYKKADRTPKQAGMVLHATIPTEYKRGFDKTMLYDKIKRRPEWKPYLITD